MNIKPETHRIIKRQLKERTKYVLIGTKLEFDSLFDHTRGSKCLTRTTKRSWRRDDYQDESSDDSLWSVDLTPFEKKRGKKGVIRGWEIGNWRTPSQKLLNREEEIHVLPFIKLVFEKNMRAIGTDITCRSVGIL